MAARELKRNFDTRYCTFYIDSNNDIPSLPTNNESGKGELSLSAPCSIGSVARDAAGKRYTLNGNNKWVVFTTNSGLGGSEAGGEIDVEVATDEEVADMLDDVFA